MKRYEHCCASSSIDFRKFPEITRNSADYEMTPPFKRRRRTVFTEKQLQGLEEAYGKSQYLDRESRLELCKKLSLSLHTVVYWFQNKRAISRRRGQPMENSGANSNSSSIENIHAYTSENVKNFKTSPSFKRSPPHSPIQFVSLLIYDIIINILTCVICILKQLYEISMRKIVQYFSNYLSALTRVTIRQRAPR